MEAIKYEISYDNQGNWETLGGIFYDTPFLAECALMIHWKELDIAQIDYKMDNYQINKIDL